MDYIFSWQGRIGTDNMKKSIKKFWGNRSKPTKILILAFAGLVTYNFVTSFYAGYKAEDALP